MHCSLCYCPNLIAQHQTPSHLRLLGHPLLTRAVRTMPPCVLRRSNSKKKSTTTASKASAQEVQKRNYERRFARRKSRAKSATRMQPTALLRPISTNRSSALAQNTVLRRAHNIFAAHYPAALERTSGLKSRRSRNAADRVGRMTVKMTPVSKAPSLSRKSLSQTSTAPSGLKRALKAGKDLWKWMRRR